MKLKILEFKDWKKEYKEIFDYIVEEMKDLGIPDIEYRDNFPYGIIFCFEFSRTKYAYDVVCLNKKVAELLGLSEFNTMGYKHFTTTTQVKDLLCYVKENENLIRLMLLN